MNFISTRIVTTDVPGLTAFYERVTGTDAVWSADVFAEIVTPSGTLAIADIKTMALFAGAAVAAENRSLFLEFIVDDVDAEYTRLGDVAGDLVQEPTTMPWGNRSLVFRDPDGNLVNLFAPVTEDAIARFRGVTRSAVA
ncbi:MAG: VOC family protein [Solirubrobacteraceae bacterium]|nr:VOC family protein [Patulibacter sp.]